MLQIGFSSEAIQHRIKRGRLHPVYRGVYAIGRPEMSRFGQWMAAVLSCGDGAVLSHATAAALWELRPLYRGKIDVSVSRAMNPSHPGLRVHRRTLSEPDATLHHAIPVTTPVCTLIDIAPLLSSDRLEAAVNEADKRDLVDPEGLRIALDEVTRRPGVGVLRRLLDHRTFTLTDSGLERQFIPLALGAGLGMPLTGQWVNGFKVDFYWPDLRLVVETDGLRYHRTAAQQARDRIRDQAHLAAGITPLRFTRAQIRFEPKGVQATLKAVVARLRDAARLA